MRALNRNDRKQINRVTFFGNFHRSRKPSKTSADYRNPDTVFPCHK
jgi:hypothetical protein